MDKKEILKSLNKRVTNGTKISNIERDANLPKNSLATVLKGTKEMPDKWQARIETYLSKSPPKDTTSPIPNLWPENLMEDILKDNKRRDWLTKNALGIYDFCLQKKWDPSQLLERIEQLENDNKWLKEEYFKLNGIPAANAAKMAENGLKKDLSENKYYPKSDADIKREGALKHERAESKEIPPMPVREKGEDAIDFGIRKAEHKRKYFK